MKRLAGLVWLVLLALAVPSAARANPEVYDSTLRATVWIVTDRGFGTGVLVDAERKLVATNFHVIHGARKIVVFFPQFDNDRELVTNHEHYLEHRDELGIEASVFDAAAERDVALVQLKSLPEGSAAIKLAQRVRRGEAVHVLGNSDAGPLFGYIGGHVRNVSRPGGVRNPTQPIQGSYIITDADLNPGDSGGPVVNDSGELVGLSHSISLVWQGVSNAVHVEEVTRLLARKKETDEKASQ